MEKLYLSFWDLSLTNFPDGEFRKRKITASEAKGLIDRHKGAGSLLCVSAEDLNAPYKAEEKRKHDELRSVLMNSHGIDLQSKLFGSEDWDDEGSSYFINPLEVARIGPGRVLLIITCCYVLDMDNKNDTGFPCFSVSLDSVEFHLFEFM